MLSSVNLINLSKLIISEKTAKKLYGSGIKYLVMDSGWYKEEDKNWWDTIGDWNVSKTLFPNGLKEVCDMIKSYGLIPGIWFEMENVAPLSKIYNKTEHLLSGIDIFVEFLVQTDGLQRVYETPENRFGNAYAGGYSDRRSLRRVKHREQIHGKPQRPDAKEKGQRGKHQQRTQRQRVVLLYDPDPLLAPALYDAQLSYDHQDHVCEKQQRNQQQDPDHDAQPHVVFDQT